MRRVTLLLALAACSDDPAPEETPVPPRPPVTPPAVAIEWTSTRPPGWDLEIHVPKAWKGDYGFVNEHEVQFVGAGTPGEKPELDFGWKASDRDLETHARESFRRYETPAYRVVGGGTAMIAGMPARYRVAETKKTRIVEYCFAGHGYIGYVRGIALAQEFATYGPIFEAAAKRIRYNAQ